MSISLTRNYVISSSLWFSVFLLLFLWPTVASGSVSDYIQLPANELAGSVVVVGDILGNGSEQLLVGSGSLVSILSEGEVIGEIRGFHGNVTALGYGDLTGNLRADIVVGTDNAGALYTFTNYNGEWRRTGQPRYMWSPIAYVEVVDINDDGWGDIIAVNEQGEGQIMMSWEGELFTFWRSRPDERIAHVATADLTRNRYQEVIYTRSSGYVAVLSWVESQFVRLWENYPWGTVSDLVVGEFTSQNGPEIMVITNQKMVYSWRWVSEAVATRSFHAPGIGEAVRFVPGRGLFSLSSGYGLSLFEIQSGGLRQQWNIPNVTGSDIQIHNDEILITTAERRYVWVAPFEGDFSFFVNGLSLDNPPNVRWGRESLLINLTKLAPALGYRLIGNNPFFLVNNAGYLRLNDGDSFVTRESALLPLSEDIVVDMDEVFVPVDVLKLLGWDVGVHISSKRVELSYKWGWWN